MLGDTVEITEGYRTWWSYIPHFIGHARATSTRTRTGSCSRCRCTAQYEEQGDAFVPPYLELLAPGGSLPPEELGRIVGFDLADPGFWDGGLDHRRGAARRGRGRGAGDRPRLEPGCRGARCRAIAANACQARVGRRGRIGAYRISVDAGASASAIVARRSAPTSAVPVVGDADSRSPAWPSSGRSCSLHADQCSPCTVRCRTRRAPSRSRSPDVPPAAASSTDVGSLLVHRVVHRPRRRARQRSSARAERRASPSSSTVPNVEHRAPRRTHAVAAAITVITPSPSSARRPSPSGRWPPPGSGRRSARCGRVRSGRIMPTIAASTLDGLPAQQSLQRADVRLHVPPRECRLAERLPTR